MHTFHAADGRTALTMTVQPMGDDINVSLFGGDIPHIGAVALAQPRESLRGDGSRSADCSVLAVCGHKEDMTARHIATALAKRLNARVCVACGIHLRDITPEEITRMPALIDDLIEQAAARPGKPDAKRP